MDLILGQVKKEKISDKKKKDLKIIDKLIIE